MKILTFSIMCSGLWTAAAVRSPMIEARRNKSFWGEYMPWYKKQITPTPTMLFVPTSTLAPSSTVTSTPRLTPTSMPTTAPIRPTSTISPVTTTDKMWGFYTGWSTSQVSDFQTRVGANADMVALFVHWGNENEFPTEVGKMIAANNQTMVIYWEYMDYNFSGTEDSRFSYDKILSGKWDSYIASFASAAKSYGKPIILIPFEEANGDWYPWSGSKNSNTPAKHIEAYRYLKSKFKDASNVKFGWAMNSVSVPATTDNSINSYYPGSSYVDIVGLDGFNFGSPWMTFSQVFSKGLSAMAIYDKPIMIFSMASAEGPEKAVWISDMQKQIQNNPKITGWIWFNENKEKNWSVWSDGASLTAFKQAITAFSATPGSQ